MKQEYHFEPSRIEIIVTKLIGNTLLQSYYNSFIKILGINNGDKVLDYCSGSGIISKKIAKKLKNGKLIFADVSKEWLRHAARNLSGYKAAKSIHLNDFNSGIMGGKYDKIIVHFALHDFPSDYHFLIINQQIKNLKSDGMIFIREPLVEKHGLELYKLINLLESLKVLSY